MVEPLIDLNKENVLTPIGVQGGNVKLNLGHSRMRAIYWRKDPQGDWVQTNPLPADPMSINLYFAKGFKGRPPVKVEVKHRKKNKSKAVGEQ